MAAHEMSKICPWSSHDAVKQPTCSCKEVPDFRFDEPLSPPMVDQELLLKKRKYLLFLGQISECKP